MSLAAYGQYWRLNALTMHGRTNRLYFYSKGGMLDENIDMQRAWREMPAYGTSPRDPRPRVSQGRRPC